MRQNERYRLDALQRAQSFLDLHADILGDINSTPARRQLDDVVATIEQHVVTQEFLTLQLKGLLAEERAAALALKEDHIGPISDFARARASTNPEIASLGLKLHNLRGRKLVRAARAMVDNAGPFVQDLRRNGFPKKTIDDLAAAADALAATMDARANRRVDRVTATNAIAEELVRGRDAIRMLDGLVMKRLQADAPLIAGWRAAIRVIERPGPKRG